MNTYRIPLGFRFEPTEEELIRAFLLPRVMGHQLPWDGIVEKNLYGKDAAPWAVLGDAPPQSWRTKREGGVTKSTIYAFTTLPNDPFKRKPRGAGGGTWSAQTGAKEIKNADTGDIIGYKRSLKFQPPNSDDDVASSDLAHWAMREYWMSEDLAGSIGRPNSGNLVVCKITKTVKDSGGRRGRLQFSPPAVDNKKRGGTEIEQEECKKQKCSGGGLVQAEDWNDEDLDSLYLDLDSI